MLSNIQLYNEKKAGELIKVPVSTLQKSRKKEQPAIVNGINLPYVKLGKSVRYRHIDLMRFNDLKAHYNFKPSN